MKKLFTILCAVVAIISLSAQTGTGTIMIEGGSDLNYSSMSVSSIDVDGTDVSPNDAGMDDATNAMHFGVTGAYFVMDGLAAGLAIDYTSSSSGDYSESSMTFGPMVRYYVGESGMWGQLSYLMGSSTEDDGTDTEDGPSISNLGIGVGYSAWLTDNISLNPTLSYAMMTAKLDETKTTIKGGGIVFGVGLAIHLGN